MHCNALRQEFLKIVYNPNRKLFILNGIEYSVAALTNMIFFLPGKFLVPQWSWIFCKGLDAGKNLLKILLRYAMKIFLNRFLK